MRSKRRATMALFGQAAETTHNLSLHSMTSGSTALFRCVFVPTVNLKQDEFIDMELKTLQAAGVHPNVVDCFGFIRTSYT